MKPSHFRTPRSQSDGEFTGSDDPVERYPIKASTFEKVVIVLLIAVLTVVVASLLLGGSP